MTSMNILLVDDEDSFRSTLAKRLNKRGLNVEQTDSGEGALALLEEFKADVVLLDVKMPGMDGLTALNRIKCSWPLIEVVMLTGHASVDAAVQGMELGAFDYLMKPVELEELLYKIEDAANRKRLHEEKIAARSHTE